jgi:NAD(P)-dependent dehydrogenase (short-subunit alcohol dehydrogenase family)
VTLAPVNGVNPTATPMTDETMKTRYDELMANVPMHWLGVSDEIAALVVWICFEQASFMTSAS